MGELFRKVVDAAQAVSRLTSGPSSGAKRRYLVRISLEVEAGSKQELQKAAKAWKDKAERMGYDLLGRALGLGADVRIVDLEMTILPLPQNKNPK